MSNKLTLGSLFDGSGGFTLGAVLTGIEPIWASEVEPFPIRVTTKRLPDTMHLGDVYKISGYDVPAVDIITAGFCCQDLSIAGRRAGLRGERSGIFFQITRIIREMLEATSGVYPKVAVLENVPGMYSSNKGRDFLEILNELIKIKDETLSAPFPETGRWATAGEIVGDGFSIAWRTLDAQYWGVAQRRRRCYLVVDFTGERAGEILFNETRLCGNPPQGGFTWETPSGRAPDSAGGTIEPIAFEPGAASRLGGHCWQGEATGTLRAWMGDNQLAVVLNARQGLSVSDKASYALAATDYKGTQCVFEPKTMKLRQGKPGGGKGPLIQDNISATLSTGNDQTVFVPKVYAIDSLGSNSMKSSNPESGCRETEVADTITTGTTAPGGRGGIAVICMEGNAMRPSHQGSGIGEDVSFTLNTIERHVVSYGIDRAAFNQGRNALYKPQFTEERVNTLTSRGPAAVCSDYVVRRLTPVECALLQGFPPDWCEKLKTPEPTEDDISYWASVWETHRLIKGVSSKHKSRNQIMKWLKTPHSDSAEYKMWGNGVALPCVIFVLGGVRFYMS